MVTVQSAGGAIAPALIVPTTPLSPFQNRIKAIVPPASPVVINEIMYNPADGRMGEQSARPSFDFAETAQAIGGMNGEGAVIKSAPLPTITFSSRISDPVEGLKKSGSGIATAGEALGHVATGWDALPARIAGAMTIAAAAPTDAATCT